MEIVRRIDLIKTVDERLEELKAFEGEEAEAAVIPADAGFGGAGGDAAVSPAGDLAAKKRAVKNLLKQDSFTQTDVLKVTEYVTEAIKALLTGNEDEMREGVEDEEKAELVSHFARGGMLTQHLIKNLTSKDEVKKLMQELVTYVEALEKLEDIKLKTSCLRRFPNSLESRVYDACTQSVVEELESTLCNMNPATADKALLRRAHDLVMSDYYDTIATPIRARGSTPNDHTLTILNWMVGRTDFKAQHTTHLYQGIGDNNLELKWGFYKDYQARLAQKAAQIKQENVAELIRFIKARNISDDKGPLNYDDAGNIYRHQAGKLYQQLEDGSFAEVTKRAPDQPEEFYYAEGANKIYVEKSQITTRQVPTYNPRTRTYDNKKKYFYKTPAGTEKECGSQLTPHGYYCKDATGHWQYQASRIYSATEALTEKLRSLGAIAPTAEVSGEFLARATQPPRNLVWLSEEDLEYEIKKCFFPPIAIDLAERPKDMEESLLSLNLAKSEEFLIKSLKSPNPDEKIAAVHNLFIRYFGSHPENKVPYRDFLYFLGDSFLSDEERIRYVRDGKHDEMVAKSAAKAREFISGLGQIEHGIPQFMLRKLANEAANIGLGSDAAKTRLRRLDSPEKRLEFLIDECVENHDVTKLTEILSNKPCKVEHAAPAGFLAGFVGRRSRAVVENLQIDPNVLLSAAYKKAQRGLAAFDKDDLKKEDLLCWHHVNKADDARFQLPNLVDHCINNFRNQQGVENLLFLFKNSDEEAKEEIKAKLISRGLENHFIYAAIRNNMASIMPHLVNDGNVDVVHERHPSSFLRHAIDCGAVETVASLLDLNANPNLAGSARLRGTQNLFYHAVKEGKLAIANILLQNDKINLYSCFASAAHYNNHDAMNMVLAKVMDVAEKDDRGSNFLHYACTRGSKVAINILLKEKAAEYDDDAFKSFVNDVNSDGKTPLNLVLEGLDDEPTKKDKLVLLLNSEANPYLCLEQILKKAHETSDVVRCAAEVNSLFQAIAQSNVEFKKAEYEKVQEKYPDVNVSDQVRDHFAELDDLKEIFATKNYAVCAAIKKEQLVKYSRNFCDFIATKKDMPDELLYLVLDRVNADKPEDLSKIVNETFNNSTLLFSAIRTGKEALFFNLIENYGANINGHCRRSTPLHYLAGSDDSKRIIFESFIAQHGAGGSGELKIDEVNSSNQTPLQVALYVGNFDQARTLLNAGANPCISLRQILKNKDEQASIRTLVELIPPRSPYLQWPLIKDLFKICLEEGAEKSQTNLAAACILNRADPSTKRSLCLPSPDGAYAPLKFAVRSGNLEMIETIARCCPEATNAEVKKAAPLIQAIEGNNPAAAEILIANGAQIKENFLSYATIFGRVEDPVFNILVDRATPAQLIQNINYALSDSDKKTQLLTIRKIIIQAQNKIPKNIPVLRHAINSAAFFCNHEIIAATLQNISDPSLKAEILNPKPPEAIPLHVAAQEKKGATSIEILLQHGANINLLNDEALSQTQPQKFI